MNINGTTASETLNGTTAADLIVTGEGADTVNAGDGDDQVNGYFDATNQDFLYYDAKGNKTIYGGAGNDLVAGGTGADNLQGEDGNDTLMGFAGADTLIGGAGLDSLNGGDGADSLAGESGDDVIMTGDGQDTVNAGAGDDKINGSLVTGSSSFNYFDSTGSKNIAAGDGNDFAFGSSNDDTVLGEAGNDTLQGGAGNDRLDGGADQDSLDGGDGNDSLAGESGDDVIITGDGLDTVTAGAGNDNINGSLASGSSSFNYFDSTGGKNIAAGDGNDFAFGSSSDDTVLGEAGNDTLKGGAGNDRLDGGAGQDALDGGDGNDTLVGGDGQNTLTGGDGSDTYVVSNQTTVIIESGTEANYAQVSANFVKLPSNVTPTYVDGALALPYWIDALLPNDASGQYFASLLGEKTQYSYVFPATLPSYIESNSTYADGFLAFTDTQKLAAKACLQYISTLVNLSFVETEQVDSLKTLSFSNNVQADSAGYAMYPSTSSLGSDVFINKNEPGNLAPEDGSYASLTLIHEIGHALGLKHPFLIAGESADEPPYLNTQEDSTSFTVMSYTSAEADYHFVLQALDIATLQYLYGPSLSARAGDDTYDISSTTSNMIWDGGGTDTLSAANCTQAVTAYLTPGYWGYVGSPLSGASKVITAPGQITINFGTSIENLLGSAYADSLYGNSAANNIQGGIGNDTLSGGAGNDTMLGGDGTDTVIFSGSQSDYEIVWSAANSQFTVTSALEGIDQVSDVEAFNFAGSVVSASTLQGSNGSTGSTGSTVNGYSINAQAYFWKGVSSSATPLEGVQLFSDSESATNAQGVLALTGVADNRDSANDGVITLSPTLTSTAARMKAAISLTDVLSTLKVYLGKGLPDTIASPLNYIAADFDNSGSVTLNDVLQLLKYYLGKSTTYTPNWQFVDAADFGTNGATFAGANGASISKDNTAPHAIDQAFDDSHTSIQLLGVLRGDVDGSWV